MPISLKELFLHTTVSSTFCFSTVTLSITFELLKIHTIFVMHASALNCFLWATLLRFVLDLCFSTLILSYNFWTFKDRLHIWYANSSNEALSVATSVLAGGWASSFSCFGTCWFSCILEDSSGAWLYQTSCIEFIQVFHQRVGSYPSHSSESSHPPQESCQRPSTRPGGYTYVQGHCALNSFFICLKEERVLSVPISKGYYVALNMISALMEQKYLDNLGIRLLFKNFKESSPPWEISHQYRTSLVL